MGMGFASMVMSCGLSSGLSLSATAFLNNPDFLFCQPVQLIEELMKH
jgi:hypothetical protein